MRFAVCTMQVTSGSVVRLRDTESVRFSNLLFLVFWGNHAVPLVRCVAKWRASVFNKYFICSCWRRVRIYWDFSIYLEFLLNVARFCRSLAVLLDIYVAKVLDIACKHWRSIFLARNRVVRSFCPFLSVCSFFSFCLSFFLVLCGRPWWKFWCSLRSACALRLLLWESQKILFRIQTSFSAWRTGASVRALFCSFKLISILSSSLRRMPGHQGVQQRACLSNEPRILCSERSLQHDHHWRSVLGLVFSKRNTRRLRHCWGWAILVLRHCDVTLGTVVDADADTLVGQLTLQPGTGNSAMQTYGFPANSASKAYLQFYGTSETLKKCSLSASRSLPWSTLWRRNSEHPLWHKLLRR